MTCHNTACSYHCCNRSKIPNTYYLLFVTILLAVITIATFKGRGQWCMPLVHEVTILLAVITVATAGLQNPRPVGALEVIFANQTNFWTLLSLFGIFQSAPNNKTPISQWFKAY